MIAIANYQAGNLKSLLNALSRHGLSAEITADPDRLLSADLVILPGVGAFPDAVSALKETGLWEVLLQLHASGKPLLGICLGMQLFYDDSDEGTLTSGLGLLSGRIQRLKPNDSTSKVPHMGWNGLQKKSAGSYERFKEFTNQDVYFVHSYGLVGEDPSTVVFCADHGQSIPALVYQPKRTEGINTFGALIGFQFHPEKSGPSGELMLIKAIRQEVNAL